MSDWKERAKAATHNGQSQLGAILIAALGEESTAEPRFVGKAIVTSDGYVQCNFVDKSGTARHQAFVGSMSELEANVLGLADHLGLTGDDRKAYLDTFRRWIVIDYRHTVSGVPEMALLFLDHPV